MGKRTGTSFKKGQSGNPGGRPRGHDEFRQTCRKQTPQAMKVLIAALDAKRTIVRGDDGETLEVVDHDVRMRAANALLDRGWGKPAQSITGEDGGPVRVESDSVLEMLRNLAAQ